MRRGVVLLPLLAVTACGGSNGKAAESKPTAPVSHVPHCAQTTHPTALPSSFPLSFPLPRGTEIFSTSRRSGGTIITGVIPTRSLAATATYLHTEAPKWGYKYDEFEAEPPRDSEGQVRGHGDIVRWQLRSVQGCSGAVSFQAFAQPLAK